MRQICLKSFLGALFSIVLFSAAASAQPSITAGAIVNAASYANPALPNSSIAQGSLFTIFGTGLGPSSSPSLAFPLSTTLGGVSISVSQGSTTVAAIPVFVSGAQVNAIMPSTAPIGTDSVTLTYQGQTTSAVSVQVVGNSFGIFTVNSSGSGPGIVTNSKYAVIDYNSAAHSGDTLIIWGTGLGAVSSDVNPPPVGNITANSPTVWVGGSLVIPNYHGRSECCSGLDQITFQIPSGVTGCNVPVSVQIGKTVSNFVSLPVAATGYSCTDPNGFATSELATLTAQGSASIGTINNQLYNNTTPGFLVGGSSQVSSGVREIASFLKYQFTNVVALTPVLNPGACTVFTFPGASFKYPGVTSSSGLDAGQSITVAGSGEQGLMNQSTTAGVYTADFQIPSGTVTFTGNGGNVVGSFSVTFPVSSGSLSWTNETSITTISRSSGVNVTWTGADPNGTVQITGYSVGGTSTAGAAGAGFTCTAPGIAGKFTVPSNVLLALPASADFSSSLLPVATGSLSVSSMSAPVQFTATGLDFGSAFTQAIVSNSTVTYQ